MLSVMIASVVYVHNLCCLCSQCVICNDTMINRNRVSGIFLDSEEVDLISDLANDSS